MSRKTVAGFTAYAQDVDGEGTPLVAKGAEGVPFLAAADGQITATEVQAYRLKDGSSYTPSSNIHGIVNPFRVEIPGDSLAPGIWFVSGPVQSYQPFMEGQRGKDGLPGTNGVATDEAVAQNLTNTGTQTRGAAETLIHGIIEPIWDTQTRAVIADETSTTRTLLNALYSGGGGSAVGDGYVSVMQYGAEGDGTTDDAPAIQWALDDNAGIIVFPPGKTFACKSPLRLKQDNTIMAYGATIRREGTTEHLVRNFLESKWGGVDDQFPGYTGNSNINIHGGTWDQNTKDPYFGNVFTFAHCQNITVRDATILRAAGHTFDLPGVDGLLIENVWMLGFWHLGQPHKEAIQIDSASTGAASMRPIDGTITKNVTVRSCRVDGWTDPDTAEEWPSVARFAGSHSASSLGIPFENINILENTILNTRSRAINAVSWSNSRIAGNYIEAPGAAAIRVDTLGIKSTNCTVESNTIQSTVTHYGIHVESTDGPEFLTATTVRGNQIHGTSNTGIWVAKSTGTLVCGNTLRGVAVDDGLARAAIVVTNQATDPFITLNTVMNSEVPNTAKEALAVGATAIRPRYVLNHFLDGLPVRDDNAGSITT